MLTIKFSMALLPLLSTAGAGFFCAAFYTRAKNRSKSMLLLLAALVLFGAAFASLVMSLGNPERIFNILSNPSAAFSRAALGIALLTVLSILMLVFLQKNNNMMYLLFAAIGLLVVAYMYWGLVGMNIKPSRSALNSWHVPLFLAACIVTMGGYASDLRLARIAGLLLRAVAVGGFLIHLATLAVPDRYLSMQLLQSMAPGILYGGVITLSILPLLMELFIKRGAVWLPRGAALAVLCSNMAFFMLINIAVVKSGNMI